MIMHIVSDQQGRRSNFRDPRHCKSASSSQLPADVHRRLSAGCSIFSFYGFLQKILSPPSDYNGTWSTSPFLCSGSQPIISQVFNKVWCVSLLDDHDMPAFDEFLGHATHLENCTVTWTFCSLQVWDRHRQCGSEGSKINLKKIIMYEVIKELKVWFDNVIRTRTGSGQVQW